MILLIKNNTNTPNVIDQIRIINRLKNVKVDGIFFKTKTEGRFTVHPANPALFLEVLQIMQKNDL